MSASMFFGQYIPVTSSVSVGTQFENHQITYFKFQLLKYYVIF